jgi:uncharacterized protein YdeI (YjbR/CyaY-like superfamily)
MSTSPDLAAALTANPRAAETFDSLGKSGQYAVIVDVVTARTAGSRAAHLRKAITALEARGAEQRRSGA